MPRKNLFLNSKRHLKGLLRLLRFGPLLLGLLGGVNEGAGAANCGRTVTIDYQEVLIDNDATQKGEGLRYYLAKDPVALSYLDKYQKGTKIHWANAALGTIGTGLLVGASLNASDRDGLKNMVISGVVLLAVNFLIAKTYESYNETYLEQAIEEYNRRHLPRIMLNTSKDQHNEGVGIGLKIERRF